MRADQWRGHVVTCALLAFLCAGFSYISFRTNSWGKWRKSTALSSCLPLPPPLGCSEAYNSRDVLGNHDTDFAWLCIMTFLVNLGNSMLAMHILAGDENYVNMMEPTLVKKVLFLSFVFSAVIGTLTCLIAMFRINIISTMQSRQGLFVTGGITPCYSSSFYLTSVYVILSMFGCYVANKIRFFCEGSPDDCENAYFGNRIKLSKTVKQHMARNIMYPDDQRSTKMVTFSSMPPEMEEAAAEICVKAVMKFSLEEDIAEYIKQTFELSYGPTWHCAVGANFGSAIHHRTNEYIEVAMPQLSMVLFRCKEGVPDDKTKNAALGIEADK